MRSRRPSSRSAQARSHSWTAAMSPCSNPRPGEIRLWSDTLVRALFDESHDAAWCIARLANRLGAHITATRACVRGREARLGASLARGVEIDAFRATAVGMSDGRRCAGGSECSRRAARSGTCLRHRHASHDGIVSAILDALPLSGRSMIDYGCGSGILGIAALKLGASHVIGGRHRSTGAPRHARERDS